MMRSRHVLRAISLFFLVSIPLVGQAAQSITAAADEKITFYASTEGVTRLSVANDRIRRIVNDDSAFEMTNDETTGDVFLRFSGNTARREDGYLITESGVTIGFTLRPSNRAVEPVIITLRGVPATAEAELASGGGDFDAGIGFSDNIAVMMTEIVRSIANEHLSGKSASGSNGRVYKRTSGEGWKATIYIAAASTTGRLVREQEFYREGVRAIWVLKGQLAPSERTFVIVVEDV